MTDATPRPGTDDPDGWPWACLACGGTIYHDGERCRTCAVTRRWPREADGGTAVGFRSWLRSQTVPGLALKVTAIAGVELTLAAVLLEAGTSATGVLPL